MAIGDPYATLPEFRDYLKITGTAKDSALTAALDAASRMIERHCNRQFNRADVATARRFSPETSSVASVDDFWTTSGLIVQPWDAGTNSFGTAWASTDYELYPFDNVHNGQVGWPFYRIRSGLRLFPFATRHIGMIQVTAKWGWESVPAPVKQACLGLAHQHYKRADAPHGVMGFDNFGPVRTRVDPQIAEMLSQYESDSTFGLV